MKYLTCFILCLLVGCTTTKEKKSPEKEIIYVTYETDCKKMYQMLKEKWQDAGSGGCLFYDQELIERLRVNTACFVGFTRKDVKNYFGEPEYNSDVSILYRVYGNCKPPDLKDIKHNIVFYFKCENQPTSLVTLCEVLKPNTTTVH